MGAKKAAQKQQAEAEVPADTASLAEQVQSLSVKDEPAEMSQSTPEPVPEPSAEPSSSSKSSSTSETSKQGPTEPIKPVQTKPAKSKAPKTAPASTGSTEEPTSGKSKKNKKGKEENTVPTTPLSVSPPLLNPEHEIKRIYGNIRLWDEDGTAEKLYQSAYKQSEKELGKTQQSLGRQGQTKCAWNHQKADPCHHQTLLDPSDQVGNERGPTLG